MESFIKNFPKIELHAHLSGSLSKQTLQELASTLGPDSTSDLSNSDLSKAYSNFNNIEECFQKFYVIHHLMKTPKGLQLATSMVIRDFHLDNVIYVEVRSRPKSTDYMTKQQYLEILVETIRDAQKQYNIIVKLLVSIDRSKPLEEAEEICALAIEIYNKHPDIVKGLDLSGNPLQGKFKNFLPMLKKAKEHNLKLAIHGAEVNNFAEAEEMLQFDFHRLGHGTFLTKQQIQLCAKKNITIECCLTSNIKCGTVKSYQTHHFPKIYRKKLCNVVLCTDDCGIFDTTVSKEMIKAYEYYKLTKNDIYVLSINAIQAAFANPDEKNDIKRKIQEYFDKHV